MTPTGTPNHFLITFSRSSTILTRYFPVLWLLLLAAYSLAGIDLVPFHGDEATQIYMSRDYAYQFIERDLDKIRYNTNPTSPTEQHLRLLNGTVAKYLIGAAWQLGGFSLTDINEQWDWGADWNYNQQTGHAPTANLLHRARWSSALLLAAGVIPMFFLGRALGGRWTPYFASLYYALNPALLLNGRRAMMESSLTFFSLMTVLAGVWVVQAFIKPNLTPTRTQGTCVPIRLAPLHNIERGRTWLAASLLGLSSGLALASKHSALFTVAAVFAVMGLYAVFCAVRTRSIVSVLSPIIFAAGMTAAVFLALNPAWWDNPLAMPGIVLTLRQDLLATQVNVFGGYPTFADQIGGFLRQVLIVTPQYYEVAGWETFIGNQIAVYEASPWRGVSVGGSAVGALLLSGMMVLGGRTVLRGANAAVRHLVGGWALVVALTTLVLTPLEWQRYYLPVYPAVGLVAALGLNQIVAFITRRSPPKAPE